MEHKLPKLDYSFDALEPFIDAKTMEIHYTKHHQAYINKLNASLEKYKDLQNKSPEELIKGLDWIPMNIYNTVRNAGGGHVNHSFFWQILKKDVDVHGPVLEAIVKSFGSFEEFKEEFSEKAVNLFGSGWTWLVYKDDKLEIMNTANQDSPLTTGKTLILGLDVWEHAYYLKYQNRRPEYINAFFSVINWDKVNENFRNSK